MADHLSEIEQLIDWRAVRSRYWQDENDLDLKRRMEAEFLLSGDLPTSAIRGYIVYNNEAATTLTGLSIAPEKVLVKPEYYF